MNRGSEWRKWDLHIHTPETAKNNQFGNPEVAWPKYIQKLEDSDISVFGITDYFSIDNYLKVKEYKLQGRLNDKFILPNVEMRIEPVTGKGTPINIHAIFDPSLTQEELNREFFREIKFQYKDHTYSCVKEDLVELGRTIKNNFTYPEDAAVKEAIGVMAISYSDLRKIIEKNFFKNKIIIALSNSSNDGISGLLKHDGGLRPIKNEICRMADIILSGNPNDIEYFLGKKTSIEEVINSCGSLKPCITGSDAHSLDKVGIYNENRITWIKADPTFDGLKQIIFEPEERVKISETQPDLKYDYNVIDRIELNTAGIWHQEILLNQNLNTIIGGRSTGKSTLLSSIAIKFDDTLNIENKDFIEKLGDNVHVYWRDGQENNQKNIEYFPQNHINQIADIKYSDKLLLQILLDNPEKKTFYEKYQSDISDMFSIIQSNVSLYFEKRRLYNEKILNIKNIGDIEGIKREISKLQEVRIGLQSKLTSNQELMAAYEKAVEELNQLKLFEQEHQKEINSLKQLSGEKFVVLNTTISFLGLSKVHCNSLITSINNSIIDANKNVYKAIDAFILQENEQLKSIQEKIQVIIRSNGYNDGKRIFEENKSLNQVIDNLSLLNSKLSLINEETEIANRLRDEYKEIGQKLLQLHISYLDKINNIASEMRLQHDDVNLSSEIILKPSLEKMLNECLSLRSAAMNDLISKTIAEYQKKTKTNVMVWLKELLNKAVKNELTFKNGYDIQSFVSKLLAECWFDLTLNVEYDGDNLRDMSPGKRSFVILKLLLDFSDKKCPILIDQPEDNLDNRAIYNELVKYIKKKKRERQIILVTHNPNIVVGADSEEIIVANQNGKNSPNDNNIKFQYVFGSIENSKQRINSNELSLLNQCGIREHVCDILEGGEDAFRDRENKYGFRKI